MTRPARSRCRSLLVPIIAGVLGFANAFRMVRTPEPKPSAATEGMLLG